MHPRFAIVGMMLLSISQLVGQSPSPDLQSAKQLLGMASNQEWKAIQDVAKSAKDPMKRLFSGYLLYRSNPNKFGSIFTRSLPDTELAISRFIGLNQSIPYSAEWQNNEFRHPKVKWAIGFEPIFEAYLEKVKTGDTEALRRLLMLQGRGDGHYAEEIASGIAELFYDPEFVITHWNLLEPHKIFLRAVKNWVSETEFLAIRKGFEERLNPGDPRLPLILSLLDNPE
jgi:hypothetical protein